MIEDEKNEPRSQQAHQCSHASENKGDYDAGGPSMESRFMCAPFVCLRVGVSIDEPEALELRCHPGVTTKVMRTIFMNMNALIARKGL